MNALRKLVILFGIIPVFLIACGGGGGGGGGGGSDSVCGDDVCDTDEFCYTCVQDCGACPEIKSMDASGDSITKAFDADDDACVYDDQEGLNWATGDTHGIDYCDYGPDNVLSHAEMLECINGADISLPAENSAESGAKMRTDFVDQATSINAFLSTAPAPRYTTVFLGHNDICSGDIDKISGDLCGGNTDKNPNDYCRTTAAAFEREFRKGLDILITVPDLTIGVASLVRTSQLCNHVDKDACFFFFDFTCGELWGYAANLGAAIEEFEDALDSGICGSLTEDCSDERIIDAYNTSKTYHDILETVTAEYAAISEGDQSNIVNIGGEDVGGATKAVGAFLTFSDLPWVYKFTEDQLSCCDCFHPSEAGQEALSFGLFDGITCDTSDPCCLETGDPLTDALCGQIDTSGTYYPGFF